HRYTTTHHNLEFANVAYEDRYAPSIIRQRTWNTPINANLDPVTNGVNHMDHRFPRNPRRAGYVFVGWSVNYDLNPLNNAGTEPRAIGLAASSGVNLHAPVANVFWNNARFLNETAYLVPLAPGGVLNLHAIWAPAFDLTLRGNGNTGPEVLSLPANTNVRFTNVPSTSVGTVLTEVIRPMPLAGFHFNNMQTHSHGWSSPLQGMVWFPNFFVFQYTYSSSVSNLFTRPATERDRFFYGRITDAGTIMPADSFLSPFNTDSRGLGERVATNTRFSPAFFARNSNNALQTRPDGTMYMTAYVQWGRWLTFDGNHQSIAGPSGVSRRVLVPVGDSVNDILNASTRNTNAPDVRHFWEGGAGQWAGEPGPAGTRGGWPIDPSQELPPRNSDDSGGDWHALFHHPNIQGSVLVGWHRNPSGDSCINCQAGIPNEPTCIHDGEGCWYDASSPILRTTTIYAIWDTNIIFEPGIGGSAVDMGPVGDLRRPVPGLNNQLNPIPGDPVWGNAEFLGWFRVPYFDRTQAAPPSLDPASTNITTGWRVFAVFGADVRFVPYGPHTLSAGGFLHANPGQVTVHRDIAHISGDHIRILHYEANGTPSSVPRRPPQDGWLPEQFTGEWFAVICRCDDDCIECGVAGATNCGDFTTPTCSHCDPYDANNREIFRPRNHPGNPTPYGTVIGSMRLYPVWRSRVTFWPGHTRGLLETDDGIAHESVMRTLPEGLTLSSNDALEQVPGVHFAPLSPTWVNDPGLSFMGWRKIDQNGQPLRYRPGENGLLVPLDPEDPLHVWTSAEVANMRAVRSNHHFEAIWQPNIMFYKLRATVNPSAQLGYYPLPGARFVLECITTNARIYPPVSDDPNDPTYMVSGGTGRVYIGRTLTPDLWVPSLVSQPGWDGTMTFRLREVLAPEGYMTPDGYWIVTINTAANINQLGTVPVFTFVPNPDLDCHQMFATYDYLDFQTVGVGTRYQFVRNMPYDFNFWKVDGLNERLEGAHLRLFVYNGVGEPDDVLVTQAMVDAGYWTQLGEDRISCDTNPMVFRMIPGRYRPCVPDDANECKHCEYTYVAGNYCFQRNYYRLVEVIPPPGHQMPMGQWHLRVQSAIPSAAPPTLYIRLISDTPMPMIVSYSPFIRQTYLIYNRADFNLPLTGGRGINMFALAGVSVLALAAGLVVWRKHKQPESAVSYKKLK
ncbi:MAG: LPXTG cell wall anchor domain-containing protein, partial [Defluviitaleaceae bacterium]|nr:LPXTG cell wall anchor domain-containing protein [Defluviitaleaceae bacterium]